MKTNKNKKGAGKTISAADGTLRRVKLLAAGQEALATSQAALMASNKKGFRIIAQAVNKLAESQTELTKVLMANAKNDDEDEEEEIEASGDDDSDDEEDEIEASGEDEDEMTAKGKGKKPAAGGDDDDDDDTDDADGDDVDAEGSDDEDGLEDLNDEGEIDEDEVPGTVNKGIVKNKGHKTTTTKMKTKTKKVPIAASARVAEHMERLQAQNEALKKKLRRVNKETAKKLEAAATQTDRRSVANVGNDVKNIFKKGGINLEEVAAAGEKVSADELDAAMEAAGIRDTQQRMAMKTQLARNGLTD